MELNYNQFQRVIDDLEKHGAEVEVRALVCPWDYGYGDIDYRIFAQWDSGRNWEIIEIRWSRR